MSMNLTPEYKQTEVGIIPDDWDVDTLGEASTLITVGFVGSMAHLFVKGGVPLLRGQNIAPDKLLMDNLKFISSETHAAWKKSSLHAGDIAIVRVGYPGTACVIPDGLGALNAASLVIIRLDTQRMLPSYVCHYINSEKGVSQIKKLLVGGAQQVFNTKTAIDFTLPTPPISEQSEIATALTEINLLIDILNILISKKRDIQQAAMQQLLTGKRRLPGFSGEWQVKILGEVCKITTGKKDVNEGNPSGQYPFFTCARDHTYSDHYSFDCEAILVAGNGEVGNLNYYFGKFEAYQRTYVLYEFYANTNYIWHALKFGLAASLGIGKIGSSIPYIKKSDLTNFELPLPAPEEQAAIAATISDMSAELSALEARREKVRQLKQGMMQELLTGRIRLK